MPYTKARKPDDTSSPILLTDPHLRRVAKSVGRDEIACQLQFYGLPELFHAPHTVETQIIASNVDVHVKQEFKFTPKLVPKTACFDTIMTITVDEAGKIAHWRGHPSEEILDGGTGFTEWLRKKQNEVMKAVLSLPKSEEDIGKKDSPISTTALASQGEG